MNIQTLVIVTLSCCVVAYNDYKCNKQAALRLLKRPAFEFSIKLLQRVAEDTDGHFIFSPLTTWLQMTALSEGATGFTFREIWQVTRHHRNRCFRKKMYDIMSQLNRSLKSRSSRTSVIAIDKLMAVKKRFVKEVQRLYGIKVLLLNFNQPAKSANEVNEAIKHGTGGVIDRILYYDDFNSTVLLLSDANYFHSAWRTPFASVYTRSTPFFSSSGGELGVVSMMHQTGYFNLVEFPQINAQVLEIPFAVPGISMLVFLPTDKVWIGEIFYSLQKTRLTAIFNMFKRKGLSLVNVALPKFSQLTEIENLPELLYDMGIKRIFNPNLAELRGISNYKVYASLMTQISRITVGEEGVTVGAEFLAENDTSVDFKANKPFVYMIVERTTEFILYAGVYSIPSEA
ncbi:unnamed protein product [Arctia plantaginis]|uniref:Serpin domain-containing protein n=1 Tax=Arctia plantaginis TaxID=874455 RepID=A0A8S0YQS1_ARCPL|nr:unnamed protein product [Arctia plantaginis]